jgi:hypothetical protein
MNPFENLLKTLADRGPETSEADRRRVREKVESSLVPLVRCAIERGVGAPGLVHWVRRTLPGLGEAERTAPAIARRLCATLERQAVTARRAAMPPAAAGVEM